MVKEANQSGYWISCQVIAVAFMYRLLKYSNQRNNILGGQVVSQDAEKSIEAERNLELEALFATDLFSSLLLVTIPKFKTSLQLETRPHLLYVPLLSFSGHDLLVSAIPKIRI